jgi:2,4-diaminopentanoate dehydrogenase
MLQIASANTRIQQYCEGALMSVNVDKKQLREPYRVAVWGPGTMGQAAIREIIRLPETTLVAVLGYNPQNEGADVSKLIGGPPVGVKVTTSVAKLIEARPEVVMHTPRDFGDFRSDADIIKLLESGINVISVLPYQYPRARGAAIHEKFVQAGRRGGATLHGSGENPGFMYERLAATMTGLTNDVQYIKLQEYVNLHNHGADVLKVFGFGSPIEEVKKSETLANLASNYLTMAMHCLADKIGVPIDRIVRTLEPTPAPTDITIKNGFTAKKGTAAYLCYTWTGYVGQKPMYIMQTNWYLGDIVRPPEALTPFYWILEIEGIPSVRMGIEMTGSIRSRESITARSPTPADFLCTIINAIQAIPAVIAAPPGVLEVEMPQFHWKPDMRM